MKSPSCQNRASCWPSFFMCLCIPTIAIGNSYKVSYLQHSATLKLSNIVVFPKMIEYVAYKGITEGIRDVSTSFSIVLDPSFVITSSFSASYLVQNSSKILAAARIIHHGVLRRLLWSMSWMIESNHIVSLPLSSFPFSSFFLSFSLFLLFPLLFSPGGIQVGLAT